MVAREIEDGYVGENQKTRSGLMGVEPRQEQGVTVLKAK